MAGARDDIQRSIKAGGIVHADRQRRRQAGCRTDRVELRLVFNLFQCVGIGSDQRLGAYGCKFIQPAGNGAAAALHHKQIDAVCCCEIQAPIGIGRRAGRRAAIKAGLELGVVGRHQHRAAAPAVAGDGGEPAGLIDQRDGVAGFRIAGIVPDAQPPRSGIRLRLRVWHVAYQPTLTPCDRASDLRPPAKPEPIAFNFHSAPLR